MCISIRLSLLDDVSAIQKNILFLTRLELKDYNLDAHKRIFKMPAIMKMVYIVQLFWATGLVSFPKTVPWH